MDYINNLVNFLKGIRPSSFLTIVIFIVGMIVPGVCGLAIYDIAFFKEIDILKLILISIGISSPSLIISIYFILGVSKELQSKNSIEDIFLIAGFISIIILIITVFVNYYKQYKIEIVYLYTVFCTLILSMFFSVIKVICHKKSQKNKDKNKMIEIKQLLK